MQEADTTLNRPSRATHALVVTLSALVLAACPSGGSGGSGGGGGSATFSKSFGTSGEEAASAVVPTADGGYWLVGATSPSGAERYIETDADFWVARLDGLGDVVWQRSLGERLVDVSGFNQLVFVKAREGPDDSLWLAGHFERRGPGSSTRDGNLALAKLTPSGNGVWTREIEFTLPVGRTLFFSGATLDEQGVDVWPTRDGGALVSGWATADLNEGGQLLTVRMALVARVDAAGTVAWVTQLVDDEEGGLLEDLEFPWVREAADGGAFLICSNEVCGRRAYVTSIAPGGVRRWTQKIDHVRLRDALPVDRDGDGVSDDGLLLIGVQQVGTSEQARLFLFEMDGEEAWSRGISGAREGYALAERPAPGGARYYAGGSQTSPSRPGAQGFLHEIDPDDGDVLATASMGEPLLDLSYLPGVDLLAAWLRQSVTDGGLTSLVRYTPDLAEQQSSASMSIPLGRSSSSWTRDGGLLGIDQVYGGVPNGQGFRIKRYDAALSITMTTVVGSGWERRVERAHAVVPTRDGGMVVSGPVTLSDGMADSELVGTWLVKLAEDGSIAWERRFPDLDPGTYRAVGSLALAMWNATVVGRQLATTADGDLLLVGRTPRGPTVVRLDGQGVERWNSVLLGPRADMRILSVTELADGSIAVAADGPALGVARLDPDGVPLWSIASNQIVTGASLVQADGGDLFVSSMTHAGPLAARIELDGNVLWSNHYPPLVGESLFGECPGVQAHDGGFLMATTYREGEDESEETTLSEYERYVSFGRHNVKLLKLAADGSTDWTRSYGGLFDEYVHGLSALDDGYVVSGWSESLGERREAWVLRTGVDGMISAGCNAYLGGGQWGGAALPLPAWTRTLPTPSLPPLLRAESTNLMSPIASSPLVVARQCFGTAITPVPRVVQSSDVTLTLLFEGGAAGFVSSAPAGIACSIDCSASFPRGTTVLLSPDPTAASYFSHWEGCDDDFGIEGCAVEMTSDRTVRVWFE